MSRSILTLVGGVGIGLLLFYYVKDIGARRGRSLVGEDTGGGDSRGLYQGGILLVSTGGVMAIVSMDGGHLVMLRRLLLAVVLLGGTISDVQWGIVPNELVGGGALGAVALACGTGLGEPVGVGVGLAGGLLLCREGSRVLVGHPGFGMGDVKLGGVLGLCLGWEALWAVYLGIVGAGLLGVVGMLTGHLHRKSRLPFAPFVALGTALHWFVLPFDLLSATVYL